MAAGFRAFKNRMIVWASRYGTGARLLAIAFFDSVSREEASKISGIRGGCSRYAVCTLIVNLHYLKIKQIVVPMNGVSGASAFGELRMLVSVVIPTLNRPKLLLRAIDSVLRQTHQEIEVIVVVDRPDQDTVSAV